jgi:DNA replication protein DnaC
MGFNRHNYVKVKEEYEGKYLRAEESAKLRRTEVHLAIPEVAEIDETLSSTGYSIFEAMLHGDNDAVAATRAKNAELLKKRGEILEKAGYPKDYTDIHYECEECGDTGVVEHKMCKCFIKKLVAAGLESSGMKDLVMKQTFDNFDLSYYYGDDLERMKTILEIAKNYANSFDPEKSRNIIMMGNTGLGKTHLSSAMGGVIIEKGNDVCYTTSAGMFSDFEMSRFGNSMSSEATGETSKYYTCDLLIIDDLGTEVVNQFTASCLYDVVNMRLNRKKPTIINTNFSQDDMRKKYQDRITSRIFGEYTILPFRGKDIREQKLTRR